MGPIDMGPGRAIFCSKRPTLAVATAFWFPNEGGAERQLRELMAELAKKGWRIVIITAAGMEDQSVSQPADSMRICSVATSGDASGVAVGSKLTRKTYGALLREQPDVVLASLASGASLAGVTYGALHRVPTVLRIGGDDFARFGKSARGRLQARWMLRATDVVVVNASHLKMQFEKFGGSSLDVRVIRNGVSEAFDRSIGDSALPASTQGVRVLYYTNGTPEKNDQAFVQLVSSSPGMAFRVLGDVKGLPQLPNVELVGRVKDVASHMNWCNVVLNVSTKEGSPNFCLQALACGRRVVGFNNEGIADLALQYPDYVSLVGVNDLETAREELGRLGSMQMPPAARVRRISDAAEEWHKLLSEVCRTR